MPPAATDTFTDRSAQAVFVPTKDALRMELRGMWRITARSPAWERYDTIALSTLASLTTAPQPALQPDVSGVAAWDTSLILFLRDARRWCATHNTRFDDSALPENIRRMTAAMRDAPARPVDPKHRELLLATAGNAALAGVREFSQFARFVGECVLSAVSLIRCPRCFRWRDCFYEMQRCGAMALPIVGLISFLVGVILAYIGATVLREYGGDIYIANLVGLAMVREMGAMMTGIILAGRTGGAFAAQIANMKANEEIDALVTFGINPVDFLVIPRLVALAVMLPLLALYANALGIAGGMAVSLAVLKIPPAAYCIQMQTALGLSDVTTGLIKAFTYGIIVGLAGCLRGLQARRDAAGVGEAATSAVVTAMLYIIVACAIYAVVFNILGW